MSEIGDLAVLLAALNDAELLEVVSTATAGRPALHRLHRAATESADPDADPVSDVNSDTTTITILGPSPAPDMSGQVAGGFVAPSAPTSVEGAGYRPESPVPTFESVRDKVERRYGTARGMTELDRDTPAGRSVDEQWLAREKAARDRLEQIRKTMRGDDDARS
ncbi:MAG: hypothetical protein J2P18_17565 [Nocardia sp.]|nr:hypothetical protein [Nocardia sp.]